MILFIFTAKVDDKVAKVWALNSSDLLDDNVDLVNQDDLLDENDLKKPDPASLKCELLLHPLVTYYIFFIFLFHS